MFIVTALYYEDPTVNIDNIIYSNTMMLRIIN